MERTSGLLLGNTVTSFQETGIETHIHGMRKRKQEKQYKQNNNGLKKKAPKGKELFQGLVYKQPIELKVKQCSKRH